MEGSRVDTQERSGSIVPLHNLRSGVRVVHRPQDAERVRGLARHHRLTQCVYIAADVTRESVAERQERVSTVGSKGIFAATVPTGRLQARLYKSPQCRVVLVLHSDGAEVKGRLPVLHKLEADRGRRDNDSRVRPVSLH